MKVILDSNFLIYCAKQKIDYKEELENLISDKFEIVVPMQVVREIERLSLDKWKKVSGKDKDACKLALRLLEFNKIKQVQVDGNTVDEGIINLAGEDKKNIVCTLDLEMRKKLPRVILFNQGKKLILTR